jgi:hypothetical protein
VNQIRLPDFRQLSPSETTSFRQTISRVFSHAVFAKLDLSSFEDGIRSVEGHQVGP